MSGCSCGPRPNRSGAVWRCQARLVWLGGARRLDLRRRGFAMTVGRRSSADGDAALFGRLIAGAVSHADGERERSAS